MYDLFEALKEFLSNFVGVFLGVNTWYRGGKGLHSHIYVKA
jgi:hypothetical protein